MKVDFISLIQNLGAARKIWKSILAVCGLLGFDYFLVCE